MARLRNEEMPTVSVDLHDIFDVNPSQLPDSDYLNGKFRGLQANEWPKNEWPIFSANGQILN